ncbi:MAG: nucleoside kinase, partial [Bacteroidales bacterium]|nr:nucleoside kinase [Bacteroidales bacterium]
MKQIAVYCENTGSHKRYPLGTTAQEIFDAQNIALYFPVLGCYINNLVNDMNYAVRTPVNIRFFDFTGGSGQRIYFRSLVFILHKALKDLYHQASLTVEHAVPRGYYCSFRQLPVSVDDTFIATLKKRAQEIIAADLPFITQTMPTAEAIKLFQEQGLPEKARLFQSLNRLYTIVNQLDDSVNYFHGYLAPSTGCINIFDINKYHDGVLLRLPNPQKPDEIANMEDHPKLFTIFREYKEWARLVQAKNIPDVNALVDEDKASNLIKISEALHEKKIAQIADEIHQRKDVRFVMIAGPSSSGKTTFSKRLSVQLGAVGIHPYNISLDNYFVDREKTPLDADGNYDFERLDALDLEQLNQNLVDLTEGKEITLPKFDFKTGKRYYDGEHIKMREDDVLIIEGIHGLNPELTQKIDPKLKYLIFISALTQVSIDRQDHISTSDNRLIRRIVRDARYRNYSALDTLSRWKSVRSGEEKYIFPFQENADSMFNSALIYELGVLKYDAIPLLDEVPENTPEYNEAQRLIRILSY